MGNNMKKKPFGSTELEVSDFALGAMYFGTKLDQADSFNLMDEYVDLGGNFLDTANNYAFWIENGTGDESEILIGEWLKKRNNRDKIVLASKVGARPRIPGNFGSQEGTRAHTIIAGVEQSLRRLGTDYLDLLYLHIYDPASRYEETQRALEKLRVEGKIRYYAASNYTANNLNQSEMASKLVGSKGFSALQNWYTFLQPRPGVDMWLHVFADEGVKAFLRSRSVPLVAYSCLLSGTYDRGVLPGPEYPAIHERFRGEKNQKRLDTLLDLSKRENITPGQIVLAWLLQQDFQVCPLLGVSRSSQLNENIAAADIRLDEDIMEKLNSLVSL
jgi:aryl-alcohol dehydrogenase-like predicted oxidoreductase